MGNSTTTDKVAKLTEPIDWDALIADLRAKRERRDAECFRDYGIHAGTEFRYCQDGALLILCQPRLQLSQQQVSIILAIEVDRRIQTPGRRNRRLRELGLKLPKKATPSQHASRSRAVRRLRAQGLLSHSGELRLTAQGLLVCEYLTGLKKMNPVNKATPVPNVNGVRELHALLRESNRVDKVNGVPTIDARLTETEVTTQR